MLRFKILFFFFCFIVKIFAQGNMNSFGLGHFYNNQGILYPGGNVNSLTPSFKSNVSFSNPSTWDNLQFSFLSLSYMGNENSQNSLSIKNGYSELSSALLIVPIKNQASFGLELSPYFNQKYSIIDSNQIEPLISYDDTLNIIRKFNSSGGAMSLKISTSYKINNLFSLAFRYSYLFGSGRQNNSLYFGGSSIISTSRLNYNGSMIELFFNKIYNKKYNLSFSFKETVNPLGVEYQIKPLFEDVNNNEFYDNFDFPYIGNIESDTFQLKNLHKPSGYSFGLSYNNANNYVYSIEYLNDKYNFTFSNDSIMKMIIPNQNWIDYSEKINFSFIRFPDKNKTNIINNLTNRFGLIYAKHFLNFSKILIEEYGCSIGFGFNFKPIGNQIDISYYIGNRTYSNLDNPELVQQLQLGISLADLWFVKRRQK